MIFKKLTPSKFKKRGGCSVLVRTFAAAALLMPRARAYAFTDCK
jgi:hypothetical protein